VKCIHDGDWQWEEWPGKGGGSKQLQLGRRGGSLWCVQRGCGEPSDHGDDGSMQLAVMGDEAAYKALEESTVNAVHNLKNLYFSSFPLQTLMWWCKHK
jgi:hypothetical protein